MTEMEGTVPMGFFARFAAVFFSPSRVFEEVKRRPTWLVPLLVVTFAISGMNAIITNSAKGEMAIRDQILERAPNIPPEIVERQIKMGQVVAPVSVVIGVPLVTLLLSGLVYMVFSIVLGGEGTFRQTFSASAHAGLIGIVGGLVGSALVLVNGSFRSSTALSAFLPFLDETSFAYKVFRGFDLFVIWQLAVLSIGMGIIQQTGTRKSAVVIFSVFAVFVVGIAAIRQAFFS